MTDQTLQIGPARLELSLVGADVSLLGTYPRVAEGLAPHARIDVRFAEDFLEGRAKSPNYPAFQSHLVSDDVVQVERLDAVGQIDLSNPERIEARFEGHANPNTLEAMIRIVASMVLPARNTLILHSSAIEAAGIAHVFSGVSGAGKSTIANLLGTNYAVDVLSDELLLLSRRAGSWFLDVAPFSGKIPLPHGRSTPLGSLNFLEQASSHERLAMEHRAAMRELPKHVVAYANHPKTLGLVLELIADLVETIPCHRLRFANNPGVGSVLNLTCL